MKRIWMTNLKRVHLPTYRRWHDCKLFVGEPRPDRRPSCVLTGLGYVGVYCEANEQGKVVQKNS